MTNKPATKLEFMDYFWSSTEEQCKRDVIAAFMSENKSNRNISFYLST